eukprot:TRINITY_DN49317_c0_g1_i1.p1 TRINITY_DN49317_c0_g1~~TRINITY_DN49317_c0_g1_i1.p1  ORF type:complete len:304 (-),score=59.41 TRINITY_DN49317_c0_g1_i1:293-1204(-)
MARSRLLLRTTVWFIAFTTSTVADQIDPAIYARLFVNNKPIYDAMSKAVLDKLPDRGSILDLASGPGEPSVTLARQGGEKVGRIVTTDFQKEMTEKAKARAEEAGLTAAGKMEFTALSADDLSQFPDGSFDAVTMCYGLMFVPKRQKSLEEIYRVLNPGGFAYISVWKELTFHKFAHEVLAEIAGEQMPEFAINPMALKDKDVVETFAKSAKLEISQDERLSYTFKMGTAKDTADGLTILAGGSLKQLEKDGKNDAKEKFYQIVAREVEKRGWKSGSGNSEDVIIPDNKPQMLTLRKPKKDEL